MSEEKSIKISLNKEIADTLVAKILRGEPLFTDEQYQKNEAVEIPLQNGVFMLKPATYRQWMSRRNKIPENGRTLYQVINDARFQYKLKKHEEDQKELVMRAQEFLKGLQKLPLGTKTVRKLRKYRVIDGDRKVQTHEEHEIIDTPVDPRVVVAKQKASEYVLDRLDEKYQKNAADNNVNVMVNLGDLRRAKEEREGIKRVPEEDYEVKQTKNYGETD